MPRWASPSTIQCTPEQEAQVAKQAGAFASFLKSGKPMTIQLSDLVAMAESLARDVDAIQSRLTEALAVEETDASKAHAKSLETQVCCWPPAPSRRRASHDVQPNAPMRLNPFSPHLAAPSTTSSAPGQGAERRGSRRGRVPNVRGAEEGYASVERPQKRRRIGTDPLAKKAAAAAAAAAAADALLVAAEACVVGCLRPGGLRPATHQMHVWNMGPLGTHKGLPQDTPLVLASVSSFCRSSRMASLTAIISPPS